MTVGRARPAPPDASTTATANAAAPPPARHFYTLDVLRAIAALCVVVYHWQHFFYDGLQYTAPDYARLPGYDVLAVLYHRGWLAVDLFFGISGFIFFQFYADAVAQRRIGPGRFGWWRLARLYPLHLITLALVCAGQWGYRQQTGQTFVFAADDGTDFVLHLLLLTWLRDSAGFAFNGPIWSISVELVLYGAFFAFCRFLPRRAGLYALLSLAGFVLAIGTGSAIGRGIGSFFLGACVQAAHAAITRSGESAPLARRVHGVTLAIWAISLAIVWTPAGPAIETLARQLVAPLAGASASELLVGKVLPRLWPLLAVFPFTLLSLALLQHQRPALGRRWGFVGDLSYSAYLLHFPLQLATVLAFGTALTRPDPAMYYDGRFMLAFFAVLIAASLACFRWVERPLRDWMRGLYLRRAAPRTAPLTWAALAIGATAALAAGTGFGFGVGESRAAQAATGAARTAEPARSPSPAVFDARRPFGDSIGLVTKFYQGQPQADLATLRELGVRWVRDGVSWPDVETAPGRYQPMPAAFAERLAHYRQHDIGLVFTLAYHNEKAYPPSADAPLAAVDPAAYGRYAVEVARQLKASGVRFALEIWNEPHNFILAPLLGGQWNGRPPSPWLDHYVKMVDEVVRQVKAFDPSIPLMTDDDMWVLHHWFLDKGLPRALDGFAFHPYTTLEPEKTVVKADTDWTYPHQVVDADRSFRSAVRRLREHGERKLGRTPRLWVTEWGWAAGSQADKGEFDADTVAAYLPRAYVTAFAAGVETTFWFSAWDASDGPMGLIAADGRRRPAYRALATLSAQLGDWRMVRQWGDGDPMSARQAYLFRRGDDYRLVYWQLANDDEPRPNRLDAATLDVEPGAGVSLRAVDAGGRPIALARDRGGALRLPIGAAPVYLSIDLSAGANATTALRRLEQQFFPRS